MVDRWSVQPGVTYPIKDPLDVLPYAMDFTAQMAADSDSVAVLQSVTASILTAPAAITPQPVTVSAQSLTGNVAACILCGGTPGVMYRISYLVTTTLGHVYERSGMLPVGYR